MLYETDFYFSPILSRIMLPNNRDDSRLDQVRWSITDILSVLIGMNSFINIGFLSTKSVECRFYCIVLS